MCTRATVCIRCCSHCYLAQYKLLTMEELRACRVCPQRPHTGERPGFKALDISRPQSRTTSVCWRGRSDSRGNACIMHRTDESLMHRTDESLMHRTDESLMNRTDESLMHPTDESLMHRTDESLMHPTDESLMHRTDESLMHRTDESLMHRTDESLSQDCLLTCFMCAVSCLPTSAVDGEWAACMHLHLWLAMKPTAYCVSCDCLCMCMCMCTCTCTCMCMYVCMGTCKYMHAYIHT